jgi:membrane protease YdiL (CAAX protease family)
MPIVEELIFRFVPSLSSDLLLRRKHGGRWVLGVFMSVAFAFAHNLSAEGGEDLIRLTEHVHLYRSIPASQFVFGLLLWDFMRRYGVWACTLSHMLHNFVFLSIAYLELGAA